MSDWYEDYDVVYSMSDLHLSDRGLTATADVHLLTKVIEHLGTAEAGARVALVLNGDIVDFLDVEPKHVFRVAEAPGNLQKVFGANQGFWSALKAFAEQHTLVLTLGNHDIELALPTCRALLRRTIGRGAILAFEGAGYRCSVGGCQVFFVHGNNEDDWNTVDFHALSSIAAEVTAGVTPGAWSSNQGSRLVVDLLNEQKLAHPFIDYLKPEGQWLLGLFERLGYASAFSLYTDMAKRKAIAAANYTARNQTSQRRFLGRGAATEAVTYDADTLLWDAYQGRPPPRQGTIGNGGEKLGTFTTSRASDADIENYVRDEMLGTDADTFEVAASDNVYGALRRKVGDEINVVVCGHTHLRKAKKDSSRRAYFNTGTWLRLMDIGRASQSKEGRRAIMDAFGATTVDALDAIQWSDEGVLSPLVLARPTLLRLEKIKDGPGLRGTLYEASHGPEILKPVDGSRIEVSP